MEDILASIKRIIAEDATLAPVPAPRIRRPVADPVPVPDEEPVLELTEPAPETDEPPAAAQAAPSAALPLVSEVPVPETIMPAVADAPINRDADGTAQAETLVSSKAASASRKSLATLSAMKMRDEGGQPATLDDLVREMLRPMLKEWLDAKLPELVEGLVAREIARITQQDF